MANLKLTHRAIPAHLPAWGVQVLESHHSREFRMTWRKDAIAKVVYVLSGSGRLLFRQSVHPFAPRNVIVIPPNHRNRIIDDPDSPASLYILCVAPQLLRFDRGFLGRLPCGTLRLPSHLANQVEKRLRRLLYEQSRPKQLTPIIMVSHAFDVLRFVEAYARYGQFRSLQIGSEDRSQFARDLEEYLKYLNEHFYEATDVDAAAAMMGVSRRTFTSAFRETTGDTWLSRVNSLRIQHACHLLRSTSTSITSIAFECGFSDLSTFYRRFKEHTGMSPGSFRETGGR